MKGETCLCGAERLLVHCTPIGGRHGDRLESLRQERRVKYPGLEGLLRHNLIYDRAGSPPCTASRITSVLPAATDQHIVAALVRARTTRFKPRSRASVTSSGAQSRPAFYAGRDAPYLILRLRAFALKMRTHGAMCPYQHSKIF